MATDPEPRLGGASVSEGGASRPDLDEPFRAHKVCSHLELGPLSVQPPPRREIHSRGPCRSTGTPSRVTVSLASAGEFKECRWADR